MLPHRVTINCIVLCGDSGNFVGRGRQPLLQPSCRKKSTTLIGHLRGSSQREEHQSMNRFHFTLLACLVDGALAEVMVFTTAGGSPPRTSMSHPGTTHGDSTSLDAGAIGCPLSKKGDPSSEEFAKEGLLRGALVQGNKSDWASMAPLRGPAPRPPWLCTVSVREGSLGEMHIYVDPKASWVPVHPCQGSPQTGRKTAGNGTCSGGKQVYLSVAEASPNQLDHLRVESPFSRKGRLTWELIVCTIELNSKGGDGRGVATCDGSVDRLGGWCMQWSQSCPYRPVHACRVAVVWSSAEQAILLATRDGWYAAAAEALSRARQLHAHCTWLPSRCQRHLLIQQHAWTLTLAVWKEKQDPTTGWRSDGRTVWLRPGTCHWDWVLKPALKLIWSKPSGVTASADAICPRSLWNCFSGTTLLPWKDSRQFSIDWARSIERCPVRLTESNSIPRKEILCAGESLLFSQLTRSSRCLGDWAPCPCVRTIVLETGPVWASHQDG